MRDWIEAVRATVARLNLDPHREQELVEELSQHLEDRYSRLVEEGLSETEARNRTLEELNDRDLLVNELKRTARTVSQEPIVGADSRAGFLTSLLQDFRFAVRGMRKSPGFTVVAIITLALGIGANTAIFSVVNGVLLRPLPFAEPERLTTFWIASPSEGIHKLEWSDNLFAFLRERSKAFGTLAAYDGGNGFNLSIGGEPVRVSGTVVTYGLFEALQQPPLFGRSFLPEDDRPGNNNAVILNYNFWKRHFDADPQVIGKAIYLNGDPNFVIGVMPEGFDFPAATDLWVPVGLNPNGPNESWYIDPIGRLAPGATIADAEKEINSLWEEYGRQRNWPKSESSSPISVRPLSQLVVGSVRTPLYVLLGAVTLVLLIACANIANLLMARAASRSREIAVRCCLGASRRRVAQQLLVESLSLSLLGGVAGLLLAVGGIAALKHSSIGTYTKLEQLDLTGVQLPRLAEVSIDWRVLLFTSSVVLVTGLCFGLIPAIRSARVNLQEVIQQGGRSSGSPASRRLNNGFVVGQFALSLILLAGAALVLESFRKLTAVNPGFQAQNIWTGRVDLPSNRYPDDSHLRNFYSGLIQRAQSILGVRSAGVCQRLPFFGGGDGNGFSAEGREPSASEQLTDAWCRYVSADYFETMGIPLLKGRTFLATETVEKPAVAIVDQKIADRFWPGEDAIGKRLRVGRASWKTPLMTVVGVVASVKHRSLDEESKGYVYWPISQNIQSSMYLVARTTNDPESVTNAIQTEIKSMDPELPLFEVLTMEQAVGYSLTTRRITSQLLSAFAVTAVLLAAIGIYGVLSINVGSRIREFGIRMALGAQPRHLLVQVLGQGLRIVAIGAAIGIAGALWLTRFVESLLFEVRLADPFTLGATSALLIVVATIACYLPARRATKVDPMISLRSE